LKDKKIKEGDYLFHATQYVKARAELFENEIFDWDIVVPL
jgi:hypothetical protein